MVDMDGRSGESSSVDPQNSSSGSRFECNICFDLAKEPVVTLCGHLFCWSCLYEWLHGHSRSSECPVCKATIEEEEIVPLYSGGSNSVEPQQSRSSSGRRTATPAQGRQPDPNHIHHYNLNHNHHPLFMNSNQLIGMGLMNFTPTYAITNQLPLPPQHLAGTGAVNFMFLNATSNDVAAALRRGHNNVMYLTACTHRLKVSNMVMCLKAGIPRGSIMAMVITLMVFLEQTMAKLRSGWVNHHCSNLKLSRPFPLDYSLWNRHERKPVTWSGGPLVWWTVASRHCPCFSHR